MDINPRDVVSRHQVYLERLKTGYVNNFQSTARKIDKAIREVLTAIDEDGLDDLTAKELRALLGKLREAQLAIYQERNDEFTTQLEELAGNEADFEAELMTKMGVATVAGKTIQKIGAAEAYSAALRNPIQATGDMLEPFIKDLSAREVKRVEQEVMKSIAQGRTISQTVTAIRGTKKAKYQDGVLGRNWSDARTVVRTATQHVSSAGRKAMWEANSDVIQKYQWVSTLDGRTSQTCRSLDGQVFEIGKGPMPPIHPNCRSTTVPYFEPGEWDKGATRSSATGPVDQSTTYYEWLKQQPAAFQDDAIGPTRGKLLRNGGLTSEEFSDLQLDKNFQPLTLSEMREKNPRAFEQANI